MEIQREMESHKVSDTLGGAYNSGESLRVGRSPSDLRVRGRTRMEEPWNILQ